MNMNQLYFSLLACFFLSFFSYSQEKNEVSPTILWEIKGKKVKSPSYLFGTIHMISKDKFYFPEEIQDKIKAADLIVMEIGGIAEQMKSIDLLLLHEGTLFEHFSDSQLDSLLLFLEQELGLKQDQVKLMFNKMKPMALMQLFSQAYFEDQPMSYELVIEQLANKNNIQIRGLETVEEQLAIFDAIPMQEQIKLIMESVNDFEQHKNQFKEMEAAYISQNLDSIEVVIQSEENKSLMEYEDQLLNERNKNWIPEIKKMIKKNKTFIAVGAGHLIGDNGLVKLLIDEGYELVPIQF